MPIEWGFMLYLPLKFCILLAKQVIDTFGLRLLCFGLCSLLGLLNDQFGTIAFLIE